MGTKSPPLFTAGHHISSSRFCLLIPELHILYLTLFCLSLLKARHHTSSLSFLSSSFHSWAPHLFIPFLFSLYTDGHHITSSPFSPLSLFICWVPYLFIPFSSSLSTAGHQHHFITFLSSLFPSGHRISSLFISSLNSWAPHLFIPLSPLS